jgi:hypothetical protein
VHWRRFCARRRFRAAIEEGFEERQSRMIGRNLPQLPHIGTGTLEVVFLERAFGICNEFDNLRREVRAPLCRYRECLIDGLIARVEQLERQADSAEHHGETRADEERRAFCGCFIGQGIDSRARRRRDPGDFFQRAEGRGLDPPPT